MSNQSIVDNNGNLVAINIHISLCYRCKNIFHHKPDYLEVEGELHPVCFGCLCILLIYDEIPVKNLALYLTHREKDLRILARKSYERQRTIR